MLRVGFDWEKLSSDVRSEETRNQVVKSIVYDLDQLYNKCWVVILDDFSPDRLANFDFRKEFSDSTFSQILKTCCNANTSELELGSFIEVTGLNEEDSLALLSHRLPKTISCSPLNNIEDAKKLIHKLSGNPLALKQAEAYLFQKNEPISMYLIQLQTVPKNVLCYSFDSLLAFNQQNLECARTIIHTIDISIALHASLNPAMVITLRLLTCLNKTGIDQKIFKGMLARVERKRDIIEPFDLCKDLLGFETTSHNALANRIDQGILALKSNSMLNCCKGRTGTKLVVHPLVYLWAQATFSNSENPKCVFLMAVAVVLLYEDTRFINFGKANESLNRHLQLSYENLREIGAFDSHSKNCLLFLPFGSILVDGLILAFESNQHWALLTDIYKLKLQMFQLQESNSNNPSTIERSRILQKLGAACWKNGDIEQAINYLESALEGEKLGTLGVDFEFYEEIRRQLGTVQSEQRRRRLQEQGPRNFRKMSEHVPRALVSSEEGYPMCAGTAEYELSQRVSTLIDLHGPNDYEAFQAIADFLKLEVFFSGRHIPFPSSREQEDSLDALNVGIVLDAAFSNKYYDILARLIRSGLCLTAIPYILFDWISYAPGSQDEDNCQVAIFELAILYKQIDLRYRDELSGATILIEAIRKPRTNLIRMLIKHSEDIDQTDAYGFSALYVAVFYCRPWIVKELIQVGADLSFRRGPLDISILS
ncbi:hypothetical protein H072_3676 [Dactylellina haptotyla CBS 200.50]|uniref:Uncharacterized protein n=1 Tax=Dactylellina haptotyla (strain CBS 200.50) TaxID=1284197 RepID=S8BSD8_DACHA|nr:hypothetical protein H072_3676 [Dactylellina haptotyla CBS 200.50]